MPSNLDFDFFTTAESPCAPASCASVADYIIAKPARDGKPALG